MDAPIILFLTQVTTFTYTIQLTFELVLRDPRRQIDTRLEKMHNMLYRNRTQYILCFLISQVVMSHLRKVESADPVMTNTEEEKMQMIIQIFKKKSEFLLPSTTATQLI